MLVTQVSAKPVVKVIDFGLAKATQHATRLTDQSVFTEAGQVIGTLLYMSPEQADVNPLDVDTRSDVFSLGAMLYELLVDCTPIPADAARDIGTLGLLELVRACDISRPSTHLTCAETKDVNGIAQRRRTTVTKLQKVIHGELDWIVMKSLENDRTRRYATPNDLKSDIARFLSGEPVLARPPSTTYRCRKFIQRNRMLVSSTAAIIALLAIGVAGTTWGYIKAKQAEELAQSREYQLMRTNARARTAAAEASEDHVRAQGALKKALEYSFLERQQRRRTEEELALVTAALVRRADNTINDPDAPEQNLRSAIVDLQQLILLTGNGTPKYYRQLAKAYFRVQELDLAIEWHQKTCSLSEGAEESARDQEVLNDYSQQRGRRDIESGKTN